MPPCFIQAMALEAGIHLEIETLDWATELARYIRAITGDGFASPHAWTPP